MAHGQCFVCTDQFAGGRCYCRVSTILIIVIFMQWYFNAPSSQFEEFESSNCWLHKTRAVKVSLRTLLVIVTAFLTISGKFYKPTTQSISWLMETIFRWLILMMIIFNPHNKKVQGSRPGWVRAFLCGIFMFYSCLRGSSLGTLAFSHSPKICTLGKLFI